LFAQGVETWNRWKESTEDVIPDDGWGILFDADLSGIDVHGADLSGINLGNVNLTGANCTKAQFVEANLAEAELAEATCTGARFVGADLSDACIGATDLSSADLSRANLNGTILSQACLRGANLSNADLRGAHLNGADLREADLRWADVRGADFRGADLHEARFHNVNVSEARLSRRQLHQVQATGALTRRARPETQSEKWDMKFSLDMEILKGIIGVGAGWILCNILLIYSNVLPLIWGCALGLGMLVSLIVLLWRLHSQPPFLCVNGEGIEYISPSSATTYDSLGMTNGRFTLTWSEIAAVGFVKRNNTISLVVYTAARRWRSGWGPRLWIAQKHLPLPIGEFLARLRTTYQEQFAAGQILDVAVQIKVP
jgi:hypothetical protein